MILLGAFAPEKLAPRIGTPLTSNKMAAQGVRGIILRNLVASDEGAGTWEAGDEETGDRRWRTL